MFYYLDTDKADKTSSGNTNTYNFGYDTMTVSKYAAAVLTGSNVGSAFINQQYTPGYVLHPSNGVTGKYMWYSGINYADNYRIEYPNVTTMTFPGGGF